ncbi:hypothetical protein JOL79_02850 [Microbispora sp. RL4-1S]|uniref:Uncharacterized protein n=1 Tax=Microbispora oryzae TaxID=2806554 RepID=A0A940WC21_9ACTN|nr:hypothetical protein [Microbispora oryzae]MBP2702739.1 hypothetical protein [Microbispora oryzae]
MSGDDGLSPDQAVREIGRVDRRVGEASRGPGRMFLILGLATVVYWPAMFLGSGPMPLVAGGGWVVLTIATSVYWWRQDVYSHRLMKVNRQITVAYVAASLVTFAAGAFLMPERPTTGWAALIVGLAVITGVPPLYAAWRLMRTR